MEYIRGLQGLKEKHRGAAITVGSFDGIHLGHGALIASTCGIAKQLAKPAMMLTFEPLPREFLSAQDPPARLTDFRERWRLLERSDLHCACVLRFDSKLRSLSGEEFVALLTDRFQASAVVVGQDLRFGRGGAVGVHRRHARELERRARGAGGRRVREGARPAGSGVLDARPRGVRESA